MKAQGINNRLVIVLSEHPVLGMLLTPYIVQPSLHSDELTLIEQAFHLSSDRVAKFNHGEQKAIEISRQYTERNLMLRFSKEQSPTQFLKKLQDKPSLWEKVKLYIDSNILKLLQLVRKESLAVYQKPNGTRVLYPHHQFELCRDAIKAHLIFGYGQQKLKYQLRCKYQGHSIDLTEDKPAIALTSLPTTLILGMRIFFFDDLPASLLMPFTRNKSIVIDHPNLEKYIENILLPIARFHRATVKGIVMKETEVACQPLLYFKETAQHHPTLHLAFRYNKEEFDKAEDNYSEKHFLPLHAEKEIEIDYFHRNATLENNRLELLLNNGLQVYSKDSYEFTINDSSENITQWMENHRSMIDANFTIISKRNGAIYCNDTIKVEQSCDKELDWFELHITVVVGGFSIPFQKFRNHILNGKREYLLPDGRFILLPEEWFTQYGGLFTALSENDAQLRLKPSQIGIVQAITMPATQPLSTCQQSPQYKVPRQLKATLRPYQDRGYQWYVNLYEQGYGGCLADDMGLGKTLQTLAFLQYVYQKSTKSHPLKASLIVMPVSLLHNWTHEIERFTTLSAFMMLSHHRINHENIESRFGEHQLILASYGMVRNHADLLKQYPFECIILDESQNIKNSDSLTFRCVNELQSNHRFVLTGTPIENSLNDLWAQFHFIQPDVLGNEHAFTKQFVAAIDRGDEQMLNLLKQLIHPFILRRTKQEVTPELPPLTERIVYCPMLEAQQKIYDEEKHSLRNALLQIADENKYERFTILNGITRLRQMACHPQLVVDNPELTSGKMERIIEMFETLKSEGNKVLIFSSFVKHLELIAAEFKKRQWNYTWLTGKSTKRAKEIKAFTKSADVQAFFISLKAGGVGLNLVEAGYVFIVDPWWNPAAEAQAIARAHRIGQQKKVIAYRFITEGSIEEKILRLQDQKRKMAETFISDTDSVNQISNSEWMEILNG